MRELVYMAAGNFEFKAIHLSGRLNILPDLLSRWHEDNRVRKKFHELVKEKGFHEIDVAPDVFKIMHNW